MPKIDPNKAYMQAKVNNASPIDLVLMLYDGAIKFLSLSIDAYEKRQKAPMTENIIQAQQIIHELRDSLNMEIEGLSGNLYSLYRFMDNELVAALTAKQDKPVRFVLEMMQELRETWQQVKQSSSAQQGMQHPRITGLQA